MVKSGCAASGSASEGRLERAVPMPSGEGQMGGGEIGKRSAAKCRAKMLERGAEH